MRISDWSSDVCSSDLKCDGYPFFRSCDKGTSTVCLRTGHNGGKCRCRIERTIVFFGKHDDRQGIIVVFYSIDRMVGFSNLERSEERRGGKGGAGTCRSRWSTYTQKKNRKSHYI